ncbi:MAG: hypothetical protein AB7U45_02215 [Desulfamplus sp.]
MTEEIDIKKLTNDAFIAIDALFTDEDDNMFSEVKESQPDDFDLIQEYMLALEWECSDKNIKKFIDFLNKITAKYSGKHNQDILKMLLSIVRYLEKSKERAIPETHQVMEFIVKTFKNINQPEVDDSTIKQEKNNAYSKVLDLKAKIAKNKFDTSQNAADIPHAIADSPYQESVASETPQQPVESIENSTIIRGILARLELCEKRISTLDTQNIQLQQQVAELTSINNKMSEQLNNQINDLELKFVDQFNDLSSMVHSMPQVSSDLSMKTDAAEEADLSDMDNIILPDISDITDDDIEQYNEIDFDGIDFEEDSSDIKPNQISEIKSDFNEVALDEIGFDEIYIDDSASSAAQRGAQDNTSVDSALNSASIGVLPDEDKAIFDDMILEEKGDEAEEITIDEIEYEEITQDAIEYDDHNNTDIDISSKPEDLFTKNVRCFKIENQSIAIPDDKIYNIYKIPAKLTKTISSMPVINLGEFASLFQSLSKNMKGHLKDVSSSILKKMNVNIHLLTTQNIEYHTAILCYFDNKVSIIPVTDIYDNRTYFITDIINGRNSFSDYNVNIADIGLIPFMPLAKE